MDLRLTVKIHGAGGYFLRESEQETLNLQLDTLEYADESLIDFEVNNLHARTPSRGTVFYTLEGFVMNRGGWEAVWCKITTRNQPHTAGVDETNMNASFPDAS